MAFAFPWSWLSQSPVQRPDLQFLLYTRTACPLCDEAAELLEHYQKRYGFALDAMNVDESDELLCSFGNCVPVVAINGKVRFRGRINEVLLQRILDAR